MEACLLKSSEENLKNLYETFASRGNKRGVAGGYNGGTAASGGLTGINDYADSVYSAAKEDLIRKIASDLNNSLSLDSKSRFNTNGDISDIVKQMNDVLPNPRKKRTIRGNKPGENKMTDAHKKLCHALAVSINNNYGTPVIDLQQSDNALCNSVSEIIHSLISGMHAEFSTIAADVSQVIRNLTVLMEYLKRSHQKMKDVVNTSNDADIKSQSERVDQFYEKLVSETNRQLAVLNNLMGGVIAPVNNDFLQIMRESDDFKGFVEDIKSSLGSEEFGNKLGYLLAGVNNLAQTAKTVDKALKEVGMSIKQYKSTQGIEDLRDEIYNLLSKTDKLTSDGLFKFMKAADVLYRNDLQHEQIVDYLEKNSKSGGDCDSCGVSGGSCNCGMSGGSAGGADGKNFKDIFDHKEGAMDKRLREQNKFKKTIFADFEHQLLSLYQKIVLIVQQIGPKIGSEIQVSDDLMKFVRAFNQVEGANRSSIGTALSGYNKSATAKDTKNSFLSSLEVVDITLDPLTSRHPLFKDLRSTINELMKLVDIFSNKFVDALSTPLAFKDTSKADGGMIVMTEPPAGTVEKYASFGRAQFQLYYFSRIASIKRSMSRAVSEKSSVDSVDYEKSMGQAVARMINSCAEEHKKSVESLNHWKRLPSDWKSQAEFDKDLPKGTPGRALYFYINTVSGFEPDHAAAGGVDPAQVAWRGNIEYGADHMSLKGFPGYNTLTAVELAAAFGNMWNFCNHSNPAHAITAAMSTGGIGIWKHIVGPNNVGNDNAITLPDVKNNAPGWAAGGNHANIINIIGYNINDLKSAASGTLPAVFQRNGVNSIIEKRTKAGDRLSEVILQLSAAAYDAKKGLLEVAQNVDLYLSSFTDSALSKPDVLLDLAKILQRVAIVRKMYTEASGDNLAHVFECFPADISNAPATPSVRVAGNAIDDTKTENGDGMGGNTMNKIDDKWNNHYYTYVGQILNRPNNNSTPGNHRMALELKEIFEDSKSENAGNYEINKLMKYIEKSVLGVRTLENILLAFTQIGNEQTTKTFMSHGAIFKKLMNYVIQSSISRFYASTHQSDNHSHDLGNNIPYVNIPNTPFQGVVLVEKNVTFSPSSPLKNALTVSLNLIDEVGNGKYGSEYTQTDQVMQIIMKAICSKVLTVLGIYQTFARPTPQYLSLSAVRSVLGGGSLSRPNINTDAVDLYVRLPLLAEWYRKIFVGKNESSNRFISSGNYMLSLIPDITSPFGEFLKLIFIRAENVEEGNYSESELNTIIDEINKIYNHFKGKNASDTVLCACEGLVSEINKRYRMLKTSDVNNYWNNIEIDRFKNDNYVENDSDFVDFDLLDSKNARSGLAPSAKYEDVGITQAALDPKSWSTDSYNLVKKLHFKMFSEFENQYSKVTKDFDGNNFKVLNYTFDGVIKNYKDELKLATNEEEKYKVACRAITDVGRIAEVGADKLLLLNELVVAPLSNLTSLYNTLRNVVESFTWMTKECLTGVLNHLHMNVDVDMSNIGVAPPPGGAANTRLCGTQANLANNDGLCNVMDVDDKFLVDSITYEILRGYNPRAAPFLRELFVPGSEFNQHGIVPGAAGAGTAMFHTTLNDPLNVNFKNPDECKYLSTKRLLKAHLQLFANLKSCTKGKISLEFTNKGYPIVNFSQFNEYAESVFNNVKKSIVYLRSVIPKDILRKYEDAKHVGSVYWLEENFFSDLLYNEKKNKSLFASTNRINGNTVTAAILEGNNSAEITELKVTLPQLNSVLKSSFDVIKARKSVVGQEGGYEQAVAELCLYNIIGKQFRQNLNSESASAFPFNVTDLVDDLDPGVGKIRKLLFDKEFQTQVNELVKNFGSLDRSQNLPTNQSLYRLLRILSPDLTAANAVITDPKFMPVIPLNANNIVFNNDIILKTILNGILNDFVHNGQDMDTVIPNNPDKIGRTSFGIGRAVNVGDVWVAGANSENIAVPNFNPIDANPVVVNAIPATINEFIQAGVAPAAGFSGSLRPALNETYPINTNGHVAIHALARRLASTVGTNTNHVLTNLYGNNMFNFLSSINNGSRTVAGDTAVTRLNFVNIIVANLSAANPNVSGATISAALSARIAGAPARAAALPAHASAVALAGALVGALGRNSNSVIYAILSDIFYWDVTGGIAGGVALAGGTQAAIDLAVEDAVDDVLSAPVIEEMATLQLQYLEQQLDYLNERFNPYTEILSLIYNPDIEKQILNINNSPTFIQHVKNVANSVEHLRASIAYHHIRYLTRDNALAIDALGFQKDIRYILYCAGFVNTWNNGIKRLVCKVYQSALNNLNKIQENSLLSEMNVHTETLDLNVFKSINSITSVDLESNWRGANALKLILPETAMARTDNINSDKFMILDAMSNLHSKYRIIRFEMPINAGYFQSPLDPTITINNNLKGLGGSILPPDRSVNILAGRQSRMFIRNSLDFTIDPADELHAEAYVRKLLISTNPALTSNKDEALKLGFERNYGLLTGKSFNDKPFINELGGSNIAYVVQRINFYDASENNYDFFDNDKKDELKSIFNGKGLLAQFNQAVASYMASFIEEGTKKFYTPLIEGMVNSRASDAITAGNAIADINITDEKAIGYPPEGAILCASIARAVRSILNKRLENSKDYQYATNSLLEVSSFMRETMKCNLPHFARLFEQLSEIAVFYKRILLESTTLKYERKIPATLTAARTNFYNSAAFDNTENLITKTQKKYIDPFEPKTESECTRYYRTLLDNIENSCSAILRSINQVYKELNDAPLFGETYSGSIMEVKNKTGKYPLTLPSGLQVLLHHQRYEKGFGLPNAKIGTDKYKIDFMFRGMAPRMSRISGGGSILDFFPGLVELTNNYNALNPDASKIPRALIESSIKNNLDLMDLLLDLKVRNSWILDSQNVGVGVFRRELYASAQEYPLDYTGYAGMTRANQKIADTDLRRVVSNALGLAPNTRNQSLFYLKSTRTGKINWGLENDEQYNISVFSHDVVNTENKKFRAGALGAPVTVTAALLTIPEIAGRLAPVQGAIYGTAANSEALYIYPDIGMDTVGNINPLNMLGYALTANYDLLNLLSLFESSDISYNKTRLSRYFKPEETSNNSRDEARFFNILDLNLVPINFHMLAKDIPLINLLNYSFTFDKYVVERLAINSSSIWDDSKDEVFSSDENKVNDIKTALGRMLVHPHAAVSYNHFSNWHMRVALGATGSDIPMDRPKYFSDQIIGKVCIQDLNPSGDRAIAGPATVYQNEGKSLLLDEFTRYLQDHAEVGHGPTAAAAFTVGNAPNQIPASQRKFVSAIRGNTGALADNADLMDLAGDGINGAAGGTANDNLFRAAAAPTAAAPAIPAIGFLAQNILRIVNVQAIPATVDRFAWALIRKVHLHLGEITPLFKVIRKALLGHAAFVKSQISLGAACPQTAISPDLKYSYDNGVGAGPQHTETYFTAPHVIRSIFMEVVSSMNVNSMVRVTPITQLHYLTQPDENSNEVKPVDLLAANAATYNSATVGVLGKLRYDTKLVRNLSWFSHLHRVLLWSIKEALRNSSQPVVTNRDITDPSVIDFRGYQSVNRNEYHL